MGTLRKKTVTLSAGVASWLLLNLDLLQTKNLREARLLMGVIAALESKFDNSRAERIRAAADQKLQLAQEAKKEDSASEEEEALLRTSKFLWFRQVYAQMDAEIGSFEIAVSEEAIDYAVTRLSELPYDGVGRALLVKLADAVDAAPAQ